MKHALFLIIATLILHQPRAATATEPSVDDVRHEALRVARLDGRLDRWSRRARLRHLLPEITATAGRDDQTDDNVQYDEWLTRDGEDRLLWDSARNQNENNRRFRAQFSIRASVDLGGLVFDNAELAAARETRMQIEARAALVEAVHLSYFARRSALADLGRTDPRNTASWGTAVERVRILEARLDGLTEGWFSRQLRGSR